MYWLKENTIYWPCSVIQSKWEDTCQKEVKIYLRIKYCMTSHKKSSLSWYRCFWGNIQPPWTFLTPCLNGKRLDPQIHTTGAECRLNIRPTDTTFIWSRKGGGWLVRNYCLVYAYTCLLYVNVENHYSYIKKGLLTLLFVWTFS